MSSLNPVVSSEQVRKADIVDSTIHPLEELIDKIGAMHLRSEHGQTDLKSIKQQLSDTTDLCSKEKRSKISKLSRRLVQHIVIPEMYGNTRQIKSVWDDIAHYAWQKQKEEKKRKKRFTTPPYAMLLKKHRIFEEKVRRTMRSYDFIFLAIKKGEMPPTIGIHPEVRRTALELIAFIKKVDTQHFTRKDRDYYLHKAQKQELLDQIQDINTLYLSPKEASKWGCLQKHSRQAAITFAMRTYKIPTPLPEELKYQRGGADHKGINWGVRIILVVLVITLS